jgi:hypothetical protein
MSISESEQYNLLDRLAEELPTASEAEASHTEEYTDATRSWPRDPRLFPALVKVEQAEGVRRVEG